MNLRSTLKSAAGLFGANRNPRSRPSVRRTTLTLEALEQRDVPSATALSGDIQSFVTDFNNSVLPPYQASANLPAIQNDITSLSQAAQNGRTDLAVQSVNQLQSDMAATPLLSGNTQLQGDLFLLQNDVGVNPYATGNPTASPLISSYLGSTPLYSPTFSVQDGPALGLSGDVAKLQSDFTNVKSSYMLTTSDLAIQSDINALSTAVQNGQTTSAVQAVNQLQQDLNSPSASASDWEFAGDVMNLQIDLGMTSIPGNSSTASPPAGNSLLNAPWDSTPPSSQIGASSSLSSSFSQSDSTNTLINDLMLIELAALMNQYGF